MESKQVEVITLRHASGVHASICTYGARLHALGYSKDSNVIVAPNETEKYYQLAGYVGATIGPLANLIRDGKIETSYETQTLDENYGRHHLHGGRLGLDKQHWAVALQTEECVCLTWEEQSLGRFFVEFQILENGLAIRYHLEAFRDLVVNMTNHAYFNLTKDRTIYRHGLHLSAKQVVSTDTLNIPLDKVEHIEGTEIDFSQPKRLDFLQLPTSIRKLSDCRGLNHCFLFEQGAQEVTLISPENSSPNLTVKSTKPAVQLYSANNELTINQERNETHGALCIEPMYSTADQFQGDHMRSLIKRGEKYSEQDHYLFTY